MNTRIAKAVERFNAAQKSLRETILAEQRKCKHETVIHSKWRASEWGLPFKARRLCLCCGTEEEARNSGWGDDDADFPTLKTNGFHKFVDDSTLYRSRFPEAPVDTDN